MTLDAYIQLNNIAFLAGIVAIGLFLSAVAWVAFEKWISPWRDWPKDGAR